MNQNDSETTAAAAARAAAGTGAAPDAPAESIVPAEPPPLSREQWEELKARADKADENWDRFLRAAADLENYKKRAARERQEAVQYANETLVSKLLPVLDNFDRALAAADAGQSADAAALRAGVEMIRQQLHQVLAESGLEVVDGLGQPFDPRVHEAIGQQETADVPEGQVIQQVRKGYKLRGRLLRPASVIVARAPVTAKD